MNLTKTKKFAKILCIVSAASLLALVGSFVATLITSIGKVSTPFLPIWIFNILMSVIGALIIVNVIALLRDIYKGETPFKDSNVRRLKTTGIFLIAIEPLQFIFQFITNHFNRVVINNEFVFGHLSFGGFIFAAGLAVLCISFVFSYGTELQKQSDETL